MLKFRERSNTWPGFVDLFSNLVIILIFLLIVFVFLWTTTNVFSSKKSNEKLNELSQITAVQEEELASLNAQNQEAQQLLIMARDELNYFEDRKNELITEIATLDEQLLQKNMTIEQLTVTYEDKLRNLNNSSQNMQDMINELSAQLDVANKEKEIAVDALANASANGFQDISVYESKLQILQDQLNYLNNALAAAEEKSAAQQTEYVELSQRLNRALADKAAAQNADAVNEYKSEFYNGIRTALAGRTTVDTSSDRFVVPSDILFQSGSFTLSNDGKNQLRLIANVINDMESVIPTSIDWIIRVDGHTDKKTVKAGTEGYRNNMELSLLRARAVVNELAANGVSKRRLVPTGFGELYPAALGTDKASLQQNRRIELRLTNP